MLLASGASVNNQSLDRYTPLLTACARGFGEAGQSSWLTSTHVDFIRVDPQIAETLLKHGANPDAQHHGADALRFLVDC